MSELTPRIYVASLSDYNAGRLHGVWIELEGKTEDDVWTEIRAMLARSRELVAEEHAIHDFEGFGDYRLHEYAWIGRVVKAAALIGEYGEAGAAFLANDDSVLDDDADEAFRESYRGTFDSERAYAEYLVENVGLPGIGLTTAGVGELSSYLDWDALTRWATEDGWTAKLSDGNVAVFT